MPVQMPNQAIPDQGIPLMAIEETDWTEGQLLR